MTKEKVFPCAYKTYYYSIEDRSGFFVKIPYSEAKNNPKAFRAALNDKTVYWFAEKVGRIREREPGDTEG